jgi:diguanylate cyclase (GGDEF)-like protein
LADEHSHAFGDVALVHYSKLLRQERRAEGVFAIVGGEEFALILPGTDLPAAMRVADKMRAEIEYNEIQVDIESSQLMLAVDGTIKPISR